MTEITLGSLLSIPEQAAAVANKVVDGDYQKDGLWYCGRCNTPKQGRYDVPWGQITPFLMCECRRKAYADERARDEVRKIEQDYVEFRSTHKDLYDLKRWLDLHNFEISDKLVSERKKVLRSLCFAEHEMLDWTFANEQIYNPKISKAVHKYLDHFENFYSNGKGLCLYGLTGRGKSYYAACIANALIDSGKSAYMTTLGAARNKIQASFDAREAFLKSLNTYDLLIIDDYGSQAGTEYMNEIAFEIIDGRIRSGLPLIITTNLTDAELKHPEGMTQQRIISRILGACVPVHVDGEDIRRLQLASTGKDFKNLLGL
ncbi:MAG: hypothetical protein E7633_06305 [Ruminococcaceae bacterium]|nr:hypothetical protein [Oscillospiraceae bacterium]